MVAARIVVVLLAVAMGVSHLGEFPSLITDTKHSIWHVRIQRIISVTVRLPVRREEVCVFGVGGLIIS